MNREGIWCEIADNSERQRISKSHGWWGALTVLMLLQKLFFVKLNGDTVLQEYQQFRIRIKGQVSTNNYYIKQV
jgi:hypothetical protein